MSGFADNQILFIDDDPSILASFQRVFHKHFFVTTCSEPMEALDVFLNNGPFSVVVSDMHMPGISGITLLTRMRELNPDTVRIMLTGDSDIHVALDAVNHGNIFRFLMKPCDSKVLAAALVDGIKQFNLVTAEHELLEQTLKKSVQVLVDVLSMTNPLAFNRAKRISGYALQIARMLKLADPWQYEVAALLSQIGCIALPPKTIEKYFSGIEMTDDEKTMIRSYPQTGYELLHAIPRLDRVATMIRLQQQTLPAERYKKPLSQIEPELLGGLILKSCMEFESIFCVSRSKQTAAARMRESSAALIPELLDCFGKLITITYNADEFILFKIADIGDGMVLAEDVVSSSGTLLVGKDSVVSPVIRHSLINFMRQGSIGDTVKVAIQR